MQTTDTAGYKSLFLTTAQEHLTSAVSLLQGLSGKNNSKTAEEFFRHIHSLKGSSDVMGYSEIAKVCGKIVSLVHPSTEIYSLENDQIPQLHTLVGSLQEQLEQIKKS